MKTPSCVCATCRPGERSCWHCLLLMRIKMITMMMTTMVVITLMMTTMRVFMTIKLIMIWRIMVMVVVIIVPTYFASEEKKMVRWIFSKRKREDMRRGEKPELGLEFLSYAVFPFFAQWSYTAATHWIEFFKKSAHSTSTDCEVFSLSKSLYLVHCTCSWYLYLVLALGTLYLHLVLALGTCT